VKRNVTSCIQSRCISLQHVLSIKLRNIVMKKGNTNVNVYVFQKEGVCFFTRIYPG